jgi:hypothetical protein
VARWLMPQLGIEALDKPDNPLPTMHMVEPPRIIGTVLRGSHYLVAVASFNVGVVKVEFLVTGALGKGGDGCHGMHPSPPGRAPGHDELPNGTYTVRSVAYGATGDRSVSKGITVKVEN